MSASNSGDQNLTWDEQTLHHHAFMIKRDLEVYHALSRSEQDWKALFKDRLVCFISVSPHLYVILRFIQAKSLNFYADAQKENPTPIRIHPLLLSLSETVNASPKSPEISSISENDKRVLKNPLYTSPSALPLLEMHFSGQNGLSLLPNQMAVFSCRQLAARNA